MSAYPASNHTTTHQLGSMTRQLESAISFTAAVQALRSVRKQVLREPAANQAHAAAPGLSQATTNFSLRVGVSNDGTTPLQIRARVTCVESGLTVMTFPAQKGSFLWELDLPAGTYRLVVKGNNKEGGITTADVSGNLICSSCGRESSFDENYVMSLNFVVS